jgi:predicted Zn-dependent protease
MYNSSPESDPPAESAYELFSRGMGFLRDGHPHQAAMLLGRAKLIEPDKASIREALGRALYMSGRTVRARREFALALACERTGQRTRAIGHLKLAIAMRPGTGDYERALERLAG